ncbi:hypothetical protein HMPREF9195_01160 [Treponema medium ATCC 700293]|uniref:Uncharacterized protein n=1 Tax=Treponema medium ATCC 700293 TaxID=1125700 RepID=A0AA87NQX9_TREMD|nr:hypothetical protein HMPREF9195_01160 [Treponema medium ATCC 700293]
MTYSASFSAIFSTIFFWQPIASIVIIIPFKSNRSRSSGMAVISFDFSSVFTCPKHTPREYALSRNNMSSFMRFFIFACRCIFRAPDGFPINRQYFILCNMLAECLSCIFYEYFFKLLCINSCKYAQNRVAAGDAIFQFQIFFEGLFA